MTGFGVTPGCPDSSLPVLFFVFALQFLVGEAEGPVHCSIYNLILEDGALTAAPSPVYLLEAALPGRLCVTRASAPAGSCPELACWSWLRSTRRSCPGLKVCTLLCADVVLKGSVSARLTQGLL